jgi:quercetin dioxygenase-like cupin family protein/DNA-binding Xre family transcriptional regulator
MPEKAIIRMIGDRIRQQRKAQHMSIRELASHSGLSNALLSKIENGKVSSPISTYIKITDALNINFGDLVNVGKELEYLHIPSAVYEEAGQEENGEHSYSYIPIGSEWPNKNFDVFIVTYSKTAPSRPHYQSDVDEFIYVLEGQVEFFYGDQKLFLETGDSLIIDANVPHGGRAYKGEKTKVLYLALKRG